MSFEVWLKKLLKTKLLYIKSLAFQIFGLLDVNFATKFLCSTGSLNLNKFQHSVVNWVFELNWLTDEMRLTLFPAETTVKGSHHRESPTHHKQDLNLCRTWV